jgi:hypothetical protein
LGNPKRAAALEAGDDTVCWMGEIIGRATGVKKVLTNPQDETSVSYALRGIFEGIPFNEGLEKTDPKCRPILRSGICWLPGGVHEMVVEAVTGGDVATHTPSIVPFRIKIGTRHSTNKVGYEYYNELLSDVSAVDPLADLRGAPQIEHASSAEASEGSEEGEDSESESEEGGTRRRRRR